MSNANRNVASAKPEPALWNRLLLAAVSLVAGIFSLLSRLARPRL